MMISALMQWRSGRDQSMSYRGKACLDIADGFLYFGTIGNYNCRISLYYVGHQMPDRDFKKLLKVIRWALVEDPDLIGQAFDAIDDTLHENGYGNRNALKNIQHLRNVRFKHGI